MLYHRVDKLKILRERRKMSNIIKISCKGSHSVNIDTLEDFQGALKSLSEKNYFKLKGQIAEKGYSFPVCIWTHKSKNFILDGHQRIKTMRRMISEGYELEANEIPVVAVFANSYKEAKEKLLSAASQYGSVEKEGLFEFQRDSEIDVDTLREEFELPELSMTEYESEYFSLESSVEDDLDALEHKENAGEAASVQVKCKTKEQIDRLREMMDIDNKRNFIDYDDFMLFLEKRTINI